MINHTSESPAQPNSAALQEAPANCQKTLDPRQLSDVVLPGLLSIILGQEQFSPAVAKVFFDDYIQKAGNPTDPVERILLEQMVAAHYRLLQLQASAHRAENPESMQIFNAVASRLMGEVRRFALAIRDYRQPIGKKSFQVVHQQNIQTAGDQKNLFKQPKSKKKKFFSCAEQTGT